MHQLAQIIWSAVFRLGSLIYKQFQFTIDGYMISTNEADMIYMVNIFSALNIFLNAYAVQGHFAVQFSSPSMFIHTGLIMFFKKGFKYNENIKKKIMEKKSKQRIRIELEEVLFLKLSFCKIFDKMYCLFLKNQLNNSIKVGRYIVSYRVPQVRIAK